MARYRFSIHKGWYMKNNIQFHRDMVKAGVFMELDANGVPHALFFTEAGALVAKSLTTAHAEVVMDDDGWVLRPVKHHIRMFS